MCVLVDRAIALKFHRTGSCYIVWQKSFRIGPFRKFFVSSLPCRTRYVWGHDYQCWECWPLETSLKLENLSTTKRATWMQTLYRGIQTSASTRLDFWNITMDVENFPYNFIFDSTSSAEYQYIWFYYYDNKHCNMILM